MVTSVFHGHSETEWEDDTICLKITHPTTLQVEAYSVEAANPRHAHEWHVWEHVKLPPGKILIPGGVGHDSDTIEHPELVAERLCNYASVVGRDNVIAGTDCGFGTSRLHPTIAHLKFQAMVEGASLASQRLWGR